jgi:hypothetical protein
MLDPRGMGMYGSVLCCTEVLYCTNWKPPLRTIELVKGIFDNNDVSSPVYPDTTVGRKAHSSLD